MMKAIRHLQLFVILVLAAAIPSSILFSSAQNGVHVLIPDIAAASHYTFWGFSDSPKQDSIYAIGQITTQAPNQTISVFSIKSNTPFEWSQPTGNYTLPFAESTFSSTLLTYIDTNTSHPTIIAGGPSGSIYFIDLEDTFRYSSYISAATAPIVSIALRTGHNQAFAIPSATSRYNGVLLVDLRTRTVINNWPMPAALVTFASGYGNCVYDQSSDTLFFLIQSFPNLNGLASLSMATQNFTILYNNIQVPMLQLTSASSLYLELTAFQSLYLVNENQLIRYPLSDFGPLPVPPPSTPPPTFTLWAPDPSRGLLYLATIDDIFSTITISCTDPSSDSGLCTPTVFNSLSTDALCGIAYSNVYQTLFIGMCSTIVYGVSTANLANMYVTGNTTVSPVNLGNTPGVTLAFDEQISALLVLQSTGLFTVLPFSSFPPPSSTTFSNQYGLNLANTSAGYAVSQSFSDMELLGRATVAVMCTLPPCTFVTINYANLSNVFMSSLQNCPVTVGIFVPAFFAYEPNTNQLVILDQTNQVLGVNPFAQGCAIVHHITLPYDQNPSSGSLSVYPPTQTAFVTVTSTPSDVTNVIRLNMTSGHIAGVVALPAASSLLLRCQNSSFFIPNTVMASNVTATYESEFSLSLQVAITPIQPSNLTLLQQSNNVYTSTIPFNAPGSRAFQYLPQLSQFQSPQLLLTAASTQLLLNGQLDASIFYIDPYSLLVTKQFSNYDSMIPIGLQEQDSDPSTTSVAFPLNAYFLRTNWTSTINPALPYDIIIAGLRSDGSGSFAKKYLTSCPGGTSNVHNGATDCLPCAPGYSSPGGVGSTCLACGSLANYPNPMLTYCPVASASAVPQPVPFIHIPDSQTSPLQYLTENAAPGLQTDIIVLCSALSAILFIALGVWASGHWKIAIRAVMERPSHLNQYSANSEALSSQPFLHELDSFSFNHFTERNSFVFRHSTSLGGWMTLLCCVGSIGLLLTNFISYARFNDLSSSSVQQGASDSFLDLSISAQLWGLPAAACIDLRSSNTFTSAHTASTAPAPNISFIAQPQFPYPPPTPALSCAIQWKCSNCFLPAGLLQTIQVQTNDIRGLSSSVVFSITGNTFNGALEGSVLPPDNFVFRDASQPSTISIVLRQNVLKRYDQQGQLSLLPAQMQIQKGASIGSSLYYLDSTADSTAPGFALNFAFTLDTAISLVTITQRLSLTESLSLWLAQTTTIFALGRFLLPNIERLLIKRLKAMDMREANGSHSSFCFSKIMRFVCCCCGKRRRYQKQRLSSFNSSARSLEMQDSLLISHGDEPMLMAQQ